MEPYSWSELIELSSMEIEEDRRGWGTNVAKRRKIRKWIKGFPEKARPAAALALSVAKWHKKNPKRGIGGCDSCGCCILYARTEFSKKLCKKAGCPLVGTFKERFPGMVTCVAEDFYPSEGQQRVTYSRILKNYRKAYAKLPAKWRGNA
jgi:hypothetical protein